MLVYHSLKMEPVASQRVSRKPRCARCRNHGLVVALKGHAGRCRFSECSCWKCALITERTRIMTRQRGMKKIQRAEEHERAADEPGNRIGASSEVNSYPVYGVTENPARAADTVDRTDTELEAPEPAASGAWAPQNSSTHCKGTQDSTVLLAPPWEYFMTEIPQSSAHSTDPAMAMPFHLRAHYASAYTHPAFLLSFGTPPHGAVRFPHIPPTALITESRQENHGFFYMPYLLHQKPDHYLQSIRERADRADVSPRQHGRDSGGSEDSQRRGSRPAEGTFP